MAVCPFHPDKNPSMKLDKRYHCFACQADGDVIDFTSRLFGLSSKEAALKLAEDFSISFDRKGHDPPQKRVIKRKISEEMRYRQAEQKCFRVLCDYLRLLERWKEEYAPKQPEDDWNSLFVEALHRQPAGWLAINSDIRCSIFLTSFPYSATTKARSSMLSDRRRSNRYSIYGCLCRASTNKEFQSSSGCLGAYSSFHRSNKCR